MESRIRESVRRSRASLPLRPREEIVRELETWVTRARDQEEAEPGTVPSFLIPSAERALKDLREAADEEDLVRKVSEWVRFTVRDRDSERKAFMTRLGSVVLSADLGGPRPGPNGHDWRQAGRNLSVAECARCGALGLKSETGTVTTHGCAEFAAATEES